MTPEHSLGADANWGEIESLEGQLVVAGCVTPVVVRQPLEICVDELCSF